MVKANQTVNKPSLLHSIIHIAISKYITEHFIMQINLSRFYFIYKTLSPLRHYNIISELEFLLEMLHVFELEQSLKAKDTLVELG